MTHFDSLKIYSFGKHCEKRRNCLLQAISHFLTMFCTLYGTYFSFLMHCKMSSAICFTLDQSKILSSGNWLIFSKTNFMHLLTYYQTAYFRLLLLKGFACNNFKFDENDMEFSKKLENLWEKEKLPVTSTFSFFFSVFK